VVNDGDWYGEFVLCRWVLAAIALNLSLDHQPVFSLAAVGGVWEALQFERRANGTKRDLNGASSDLMAIPVVASPDPDSETEKQILTGFGTWVSMASIP
jgi:hypothetical protein